MATYIREVEQVETVINKDGDMVDTHPAFGSIMLSKVETGGSFQLYGCQSNLHSRCIRLEIKRSDRIHKHGRDLLFPNGDPIAIVYMSLSQFSEFITSIGHGVGTPCTLRCVNGHDILEIPVDDDNEIGRITKKLNRTIKNKMSDDSILEIKEKVKNILNKKAISKSTRDEIACLFDDLIGLIKGRIPAAMDDFSEAADRVAEEVRHDVVGLAKDLGLKMDVTKLLGDGE
jgi:hypothetical protein